MLTWGVSSSFFAVTCADTRPPNQTLSKPARPSQATFRGEVPSDFHPSVVHLASSRSDTSTNHAASFFSRPTVKTRDAHTLDSRVFARPGGQSPLIVVLLSGCGFVSRFAMTFPLSCDILSVSRTMLLITQQLSGIAGPGWPWVSKCIHPCREVSARVYVFSRRKLRE